MHHDTSVIAVLAVILVLSVYSSSMFLFVQGVISGGVSCSPQGGGKTYCCASVKDPDNIYGYTTYCTTCDDTNPPSNCTPREKPAAIVNPGRDLSNILEGGVLEQPSTNHKLNKDVAPGSAEIIEEPKIGKNQNNDMFQDKEELPAEGAGNIFSKSNITAPD